MKTSRRQWLALPLVSHCIRPGTAPTDAAQPSQPHIIKPPIFWAYGRNAGPFIYPKGRDRSPHLAVRDGSWKLLINAGGTGTELYDLAADRTETRDLSATKTDITQRLSDAALRWWKTLPAPPVVEP